MYKPAAQRTGVETWYKWVYVSRNRDERQEEMKATSETSHHGDEDVTNSFRELDLNEQAE